MAAAKKVILGLSDEDYEVYEVCLHCLHGPEDHGIPLLQHLNISKKHLSSAWAGDAEKMTVHCGGSHVVTPQDFSAFAPYGRGLLEVLTPNAYDKAMVPFGNVSKIRGHLRKVLGENWGENRHKAVSRPHGLSQAIGVKSINPNLSRALRSGYLKTQKERVKLFNATRKSINYTVKSLDGTKTRAFRSRQAWPPDIVDAWGRLTLGICRCPGYEPLEFPEVLVYVGDKHIPHLKWKGGKKK